MWAIWASFTFQLSCTALQVPPPLTVLSIDGQDPTNAVNHPVFGLQHALNSFYNNTVDSMGANGRITLFSKACGNETQNCTAACLDPAQMFGNLETLHNCGVYQTISEQWAKGNLHVENVSFVKNLGFKNSREDSALPSKISQAIQTCLLDICGNHAECTNLGSDSKQSLHDRTEIPYANDYTDICRGIPSPIVADVAGIGVYMSYAIQMGFALLGFMFATPWVPIIHAISNICRTCLGRLSKRYRSSIPKERFRESFDRKKTYPKALTTALVKFQKAQCFFMLATNIAGLVVQKKGGLQPQSLQQVYNTNSFIKVIAIGGFLPITFTLFTLHMIHKLSWYLLILSIAIIGVAIASLVTHKPSSSDLDHIIDIASKGGPATCASKNLAALCYDNGHLGSVSSLDSNDGENATFIFCLVTTVILIVDHFCRSTDPTQQRLNNWILKKLHIASKKPPFPYAKGVLGFGTAVFHPIFFCIYVYCFCVFASNLSSFQQIGIYDSTWGFGQIVAILVWAPTLCDYVWDQALGLEKGSEHRLPNCLEVRPKDKADERNTGGEAGAAGNEAAMQVHEQGELV